ncbi:MAG: hypothetical protein AAF708_17835 [Deinococcota bacterium]
MKNFKENVDEVVEADETTKEVTDETSNQSVDELTKKKVDNSAREGCVLLFGVVFFSVIAIIFVLALVKMPSVEIELIAVVDELAFSTPEALRVGTTGVQRFASDLELAEISFTRIGALENIDGQVALSGQANTSFAIELNQTLQQDERVITNVPVYIEQILLNPKSRVHLITAEDSRYRAYLIAEDLSLDFSVDVNEVDVILGGRLVENEVDAFEFVTVFAPPSIGDVQDPARQALLFDFTLASQEQPSALDSQGQSKVVAEQRAVEALTLTRANVFADDDLTIAERISTIQSGELYLEGTDGRQFTLRPGERLRFDSSKGFMRVIRLQNDGIYFHFQGSVTGMKTGSYDSSDSLMPSILEFFISKTSAIAIAIPVVAAFIGLFVSFGQLTKYLIGQSE